MLKLFFQDYEEVFRSNICSVLSILSWVAHMCMTPGWPELGVQSVIFIQKKAHWSTQDHIPDLSLVMCRCESTVPTSCRHAGVSWSVPDFLTSAPSPPRHNRVWWWFIREAAMHISASRGRNQNYRLNNLQKLIRFKSAPSLSTSPSPLHWLLFLGTLMYKSYIISQEMEPRVHCSL